VIDTGVDVDQIVLAGAVTVHRAPAGKHTISRQASDPIGHDTAVVRATADRAGMPMNSVGLADWSNDDSSTELIRAIEWCIENGIQVINISAGTTSPATASPLHAACASAAAAGIIIVAAEHNDGLVSYPAHLPSVIGVRGGKIFGDETYLYCPDQPIECIARGDAQRLLWRDGKQVLIGGNSFAAPRITGIVARLKRQHPEAGTEEIRRLLRHGAARIVEPDTARSSTRRWSVQALPQIRSAALYPYTKEMHALCASRIGFHSMSRTSRTHRTAGWSAWTRERRLAPRRQDCRFAPESLSQLKAPMP
jgi:subtilisin